MAKKISFRLGRSDKIPIDADYIVESGTIGSKSDVNNYIQNLNIAHNGMQIWFRDIDLGCIVVDPSTGEYVELGGGGIALVSDSSEETSFVNGLTSDDEGQLIYNQSEDKYKKYDGSSLIESSGQIITEDERNRISPNTKVIASLPSVTVDGVTYSEYDLSESDFGFVIKFDANSINVESGGILIRLPINTQYPVGWNAFFIAITASPKIHFRPDTTDGGTIGDDLLPFNEVDALSKYMSTVYNIRKDTSSSNSWSVIGNVIDGT